MPTRSKKSIQSTSKKKVVTWEANNPVLAFRVRKFYELFRAGEMFAFHQQVAKSPVPSTKMKEVQVFITEVNVSVDRGLNKEKLAELNSLLLATKKIVRKKVVAKKVGLQTNFLPSKELEQRFGVVVLPLLQTRHAELFVSLVEKEVLPHIWQAFWKQAIPQFSALAEKIQHTSSKENLDQQKIKKVFMQTKRSVLEVLAPLTKKNTAVPGYFAVISALGQSAWWAAAEISERVSAPDEAPTVLEEGMVEETATAVTGFLDQLYDDGVFLQIRYRLTITKDECTVVFEEDSLVVGFDPTMFLNTKLFLGLSSHQQKRVQSAVETIYVYGRMLETAEKGSNVARGLKELLKHEVAQFSLTYGQNLLKMHR